MSDTVLMILVTGGFLVLLMGGMWVPFAVGLTALGYLLAIMGPAGLKAVGLVSWSSANSFLLTAIPLFVFMSAILSNAGLSHRVYAALSQLVRRLPGGLLQTNIAGCTMFAAISGSSVATAAAIGSIALPQLKARGYDARMASGSLAAGGTLGILLPPSIAMIIYGTFTDTSIAKLFMAGIIPGLLVAGAFMVYIAIRCLINPRLAPKETADSDHSRIGALLELTPFVLLIGLVLGSLYAGLATPTEVAAIGCVASFAIAAAYRSLTWQVLVASLVETIRISGSILFIVLSAYLLSYAMTMGGIAQQLASWIADLGLSRLQIIIAIAILYIVLGWFVESMAMIVITVPMLFPVLVMAGIDPLWFGIILVLFVEIGQISPPFGINLFVIQNLMGGRYSDMVMGAVPYMLILLGMVAVFTIWPEIITWLPSITATR